MTGAVRAAAVAMSLALVACFGLQGPRDDTSIDLPVGCGIELVNRSSGSFALLESVPLLDLGDELRPAERRRVEASCEPPCYVVRAYRSASSTGTDPAGHSTVTVRPRRLAWARAELREPDPFGSAVGLMQAANRAGCV